MPAGQFHCPVQAAHPLREFLGKKVFGEPWLSAAQPCSARRGRRLGARGSPGTARGRGRGRGGGASSAAGGPGAGGAERGQRCPSPAAASADRAVPAAASTRVRRRGGGGAGAGARPEAAPALGAPLPPPRPPATPSEGPSSEGPAGRSAGGEGRPQRRPFRRGSFLSPVSFVCSPLAAVGTVSGQKCSLKMADGNDDPRDDLPGPAYESCEAAELACPAERSGHVAVGDGRHMFVWGGYKSNQVRGLYDFYLPREELWIYNMETGRWKKMNTEGDVPPSMSGSCAVCVDRMLYLFGGHHSRGNTNKFYMLDLRSTDRVLQWERIDCQGIPPSSKDKLGVWVYKNRLIFFGGYGYLPEDKVLGTFEFDETSFWNSSHPRGWNDHVHILDTETFIWSQPITTGKAPSPRAAHACATVGNKGFVFGGRYRDARMNDLHYLNLDTWEWNELIPQGLCPAGRSWHSLTPVSSDHLFLFGGFTTDKQPLSDAWTYCISKNEWLQFNHPYTDKPRLWHTACASDEGEVIVFGGCANNLLVHHRAAHSNEVLIFSVQPKSLVRLSLEAVICFKEMLANSWNCLPKHLLHSVHQRFGSNNTSGS